MPDAATARDTSLTIANVSMLTVPVTNSGRVEGLVAALNVNSLKAKDALDPSLRSARASCFAAEPNRRRSSPCSDGKNGRNDGPPRNPVAAVAFNVRYCIETAERAGHLPRKRKPLSSTFP